MRDLRCKGFTLIEMMIVVALVVILGAIAYPSYQGYVRRTKRAEAQSALMQAMMQQERYYTQNNSYIVFSSSSPNNFKWFSGENSTSSAYYLGAAACTTSTIADCVTITATVNSSSGYKDTECATMALNSRGEKSHTGTATNCWR